MRSVAVIGAVGFLVLTVPRTLQDTVCRSQCSRKAVALAVACRHVGRNEGLEFDHGAPYFTACDDRFRRYVGAWQHDGVVAPWLGRIVVVEDGEVMEEKQGTDRYVAVPGMNAIVVTGYRSSD